MLVLLSTLSMVFGADPEQVVYKKGLGTLKYPVRLNQENFNEAITDPDNPIWLLDFYAPWYVLTGWRRPFESDVVSILLPCHHRLTIQRLVCLVPFWVCDFVRRLQSFHIPVTLLIWVSFLRLCRIHSPKTNLSFTNKGVVTVNGWHQSWIRLPNGPRVGWPLG